MRPQTKWLNIHERPLEITQFVPLSGSPLVILPLNHLTINSLLGSDRTMRDGVLCHQLAQQNQLTTKYNLNILLLKIIQIFTFSGIQQPETNRSGFPPVLVDEQTLAPTH